MTRSDRSHRRRDVLAAAATGGAAGLAGCIGVFSNDGSGTTTTTDSGGDATARTMRLGVLMALSGDLGSLVRPIADAAVLPVEQINESDLTMSVNKRVGDTANDPATGVKVANQMASGGIPMVCGAASSGVNIQVSKQVFVPKNVVGCSPASTSPTVTNINDKNLIYRTALSDAFQGQVLAQVAAQELDASSAVTMHVDNDYGLKLSESFTSAFKEQYDGSVAAQVPFAKQKSSYTAELEEALGSNDPDTMVVIGYPKSATQLFKDYYANYSSDLPILVTDGLQDKSLPGKVGTDMANVSGTAPSTTGPGLGTFRSLYQQRYGIEPGIFTANAYDAAAVLLLANAAAGANDGAKIKKEMQSVANPGGTEVTPSNFVEGVRMAAEGTDVQYAGASSPVDFDSNGDMKTATFEYWTFGGSGIETIKKIQVS